MMRRLVNQNEYDKAALWYTEQFNSLPYEDRLRLGIDERITRVRTYDIAIRSLETEIAKMKRQQEIWKFSLVEDWKKYFDKQ